MKKGQRKLRIGLAAFAGLGGPCHDVTNDALFQLVSQAAPTASPQIFCTGEADSGITNADGSAALDAAQITAAAQEVLGYALPFTLQDAGADLTYVQLTCAAFLGLSADDQQSIIAGTTPGARICTGLAPGAACPSPARAVGSLCASPAAPATPGPAVGCSQRPDAGQLSPEQNVLCVLDAATSCPTGTVAVPNPAGSGNQVCAGIQFHVPSGSSCTAVSATGLAADYFTNPVNQYYSYQYYCVLDSDWAGCSSVASDPSLHLAACRSAADPAKTLCTANASASACTKN